MIPILVAMALIVVSVSIWFWQYFESSQERILHLQSKVSLALSGNHRLEAENVSIRQDLHNLQKTLEDMTFSRDDNLARVIELEAEVKRKQERIESLNDHISGLDARLEAEGNAHRAMRDALQTKTLWAGRPTCREATTTLTSKSKGESALWLEFRRVNGSSFEYLRLPHSRFKDGQVSAMANWADNPFPACNKDGN